MCSFSNRIRKVKCDENKPFCQKCVNTGRTCDGYESPFRFFTSQPIKSAHAGGIKSDVGLQPSRPTFIKIAPQDIDLLNRYFDCQVPVILDHGAEVLKFMGDGLLAIFTIEDNEVEVCRRTLAAARQARANIAALSGSPALGLRFGLALHIGDVLYGNIGSGNRLDFTCIGPAVNFAARIEKLTGQLGRAILASGEFSRHCPSEFTALGEFSLAGFSAPQLVFGLEDESLQ